MKTAVRCEFLVSRKNFMDVAAVSVRLNSENMAIAAYKESRFPSIILTEEEFSRENTDRQEIKFETIEFKDFEGYKIWSCEIDGKEMKVCLVNQGNR